MCSSKRTAVAEMVIPSLQDQHASFQDNPENTRKFALMKAGGDPIPAPHAFEQFRHDPEFVDDSADAIVTMVTPRTEMAAAE